MDIAAINILAKPVGFHRRPCFSIDKSLQPLLYPYVFHSLEAFPLSLKNTTSAFKMPLLPCLFLFKYGGLNEPKPLFAAAFHIVRVSSFCRASDTTQIPNTGFLLAYFNISASIPHSHHFKSSIAFVPCRTANPTLNSLNEIYLTLLPKSIQKH